MPPHVKLFDAEIVDYRGEKLNNEQIQECIQEMRGMVKDDKILKHTRTDDSYLLRYLHCNKFKVTDSFKHMKELCEFWMEHPNWFASGGVHNYEQLFKQIHKCVLKERDRCGRRIFYVKMGKTDPSKFPVEEWSRTDDLWLESVLDDPEVQCHGVCTVIDLEGMSWKFVKWLTPNQMKTGGRKAELMPVNKLVIHVIGTSMLLHTGVKLFFPFLSGKTKDQVKFHFTNYNSLHEYISPENLPKEYGGTGPAIDYQKQLNWLRERAHQIEEKLKFRSKDLNALKEK